MGAYRCRNSSIHSLLESRPTLAGKEHEGDWHPLHAAVLSGDSKLAKEVLGCPRVDVNVLFNYNPIYDGWVRERELGSNVDSLNGATTLHFAVMTGDVEIPIDYFKLEENVETIATFKRLYDEWKRKDEFFRGWDDFLQDDIFIMTSNIAGEEIKRAAPRLRQSVTRSEEEGRHESYVHLIQEFTRAIRPQLKQNLKRDEFIGLINQIVVFLPLNKEEIEVVVQRELAMWCKRAEEKHKIRLTWTDEVVRKLAASYDVNYGVPPSPMKCSESHCSSSQTLTSGAEFRRTGKPS
ncbi:hypothetical protein A7U60_g4222 [Sanghuangporus baumii]|uniref:Clp ATPase C-terminal domain-containing protein n=1 Tax=Sanghuangporus baumii TaxID=108892 RepID=A0A9Q5NCI6_SANBA|nr:hypothetical protein A7U60_g4222 [Sanghuangporus baumii]